MGAPAQPVCATVMPQVSAVAVAAGGARAWGWGTVSGAPPDPAGAGTVEELLARLRLLRTWSGLSYRAVYRRVAASRADRGVPERPVFNTVYRAFQAGRTRIDGELLVDIARVLLGDESAERWRRAWQIVAGRA